MYLRILQAESSCQVLCGALFPSRELSLVPGAGREGSGAVTPARQGTRRLTYNCDVWP